MCLLLATLVLLAASGLSACDHSLPEPARPLPGIIAFSDRHGRLWVMNADGTRRNALAHRAGDIDFDPSLSPDGHRVVFRTFSAEDRTPDPTGIGLDPTSVVDLRSGRRRTISPPSGGLFPAWAPHGGWIAMAGVRRTGERLDRPWLIRPDGSGRRLLVDHPGEDVVWSPDGRRLAFGSHRGDGNWQIWRVDVDGSGLRKLTSDSDAVQHPGAWSPDGRRIAFSSERDGDSDVYVMNADGRHERPVLTGPRPETPVAWVLPRWLLVATAVDEGVLPRWQLVSVDGRRRRDVPQLDGATQPLDWIVPR